MAALGFAGRYWPSRVIFACCFPRYAHSAHRPGGILTNRQPPGGTAFPAGTATAGQAGRATHSRGLAWTALTTQFTGPPGVIAATMSPARPADTMLSGSRAAATSGFLSTTASAISTSATVQTCTPASAIPIAETGTSRAPSPGGASASS